MGPIGEEEKESFVPIYDIICALHEMFCCPYVTDSSRTITKLTVFLFSSFQANNEQFRYETGGSNGCYGFIWVEWLRVIFVLYDRNTLVENGLDLFSRTCFMADLLKA